MNITNTLADLVDSGRESGYTDEEIRISLVSNCLRSIEWALGDRVDNT